MEGATTCVAVEDSRGMLIAFYRALGGEIECIDFHSCIKTTHIHPPHPTLPCLTPFSHVCFSGA